MTTTPRYTWGPRYHVGQPVRFAWSAFTWKTGIIRLLETRYGRDGVAYHLYRCVPRDGTGARWAAEKDMAPPEAGA